MKDVYDFEELHGSPTWMPLFISLMLVLLTLFIFLTTFVKGDKRKLKDFQEEFRKSLMIPGAGNTGSFSISDTGTGQDPMQRLVNRMRAKGINKKLMDEFLTLQQIKDLVVRDGLRGVAVILPDVVTFEPGDDGLTLSEKSIKFLDSISYLVAELPYQIEVKGYSDTSFPSGYKDALEYSARRAAKIYDYFLDKEVAPIKLKVSGCGDAFKDSGVSQNKVEIIFKSAEL